MGIDWVKVLASPILNGQYVMIIHPDCERDLRQLVAKDEWMYAYRYCRRWGLTHLSPQQMLDHFAKV